MTAAILSNPQQGAGKMAVMSSRVAQRPKLGPAHRVDQKYRIHHPGMPCWRLWCQFDVILSSFCWRDDVKLMSKFSSILTSIFTSNVNGKNWRQINYLTKIWRRFHINLTWHWCHFDIISTSPMMLSMTSSWHQNIDVILMVKSLVNFDVNFHIKC